MPTINATIQDFDFHERAAALASHLGIRWTEIDETHDGACYGEGAGFLADGAEWCVLTDEEADRAWDAALDSYLDECVLPTVPETIAPYFDEEAWKRDARFDGRAHAISPYDGDEHEAEGPDGVLYVIIRMD